MLQHHLGFSEATHQYSLLTVGDGLAAQIPALLISVATGIIVTRAASDRDLGSDIANQILGQRKAPLVAAGAIGLFALVPGLPKLPFLLIAASLRRDRLGRAQRAARRRATPDAAARGGRQAALPAAGEEPMSRGRGGCARARDRLRPGPARRRRLRAARCCAASA